MKIEIQEYNNLSFGYNSLNKLDEGFYNIAIGGSSLKNATNSRHNISIGHEALSTITDKTNLDNIAIGSFSLQNVEKNCSSNTVIGHYAAQVASNVHDSICLGTYCANTANNVKSSIIMGDNTLSDCKLSDNNICLGHLITSVNASNCVFLGNYSNNNKDKNTLNANQLEYSIGLGYNAEVTHDHTCVIGSPYSTQAIKRILPGGDSNCVLGSIDINEGAAGTTVIPKQIAGLALKNFADNAAAKAAGVQAGEYAMISDTLTKIT